jgi:hypothetical protein
MSATRKPGPAACLPFAFVPVTDIRGRELIQEMQHQVAADGLLAHFRTRTI